MLQNYDPTKLALPILTTTGNDQTGHDNNNTEGNVEENIADATNFSSEPVVSILVYAQCIGPNKSSICGTLWVILVIFPGTIVGGIIAGLAAAVTNGKDPFTKGNIEPGIFNNWVQKHDRTE